MTSSPNTPAIIARKSSLKKPQANTGGESVTFPISPETSIVDGGKHKHRKFVGAPPSDEHTSEAIVKNFLARLALADNAEIYPSVRFPVSEQNWEENTFHFNFRRSFSDCMETRHPCFALDDSF